MNLGRRVMQLRKKMKISQTQLAANIGITQQSLFLIEKGETKQPRQIKKIADALNVTPEWLLFGSTQLKEVFLDQIPLILFNEIPIFLYDKPDKFSHAYFHIPDDGRNLENMFAFKMLDDSMISNEVSFYNQDVIIIDKKASPKSGDFVLVTRNKKEAFFRRLVKDLSGELLVPLNTVYPTHKIDSSIIIEGVAVRKINVVDFN